MTDCPAVSTANAWLPAVLKRPEESVVLAPLYRITPPLKESVPVDPRAPVLPRTTVPPLNWVPP